MKNLLKVVFFTTLITVPILIPTTTAKAEYHVQSGDSFWKIAQERKMGLGDLIKLNPHIQDPNRISPGDQIVVRTGDKASDIVDYARALEEVTVYQYGGQNAPTRTDCSGWTQAIYKAFEIDIPRVSRDQAKVGQAVAFKDLKKGDLMFFSTAANKQITHVGIYMTDDFWISNLNTAKSVETLSTFGPWTQKYFMWARRVI